MAAPDKIYLYPSDRAGEEYEDEWGTFPWGEGCVEYIRTDTFMERAAEWIKEKWDDNYTMPIIIDSVIEEFKNHMKGE